MKTPRKAIAPRQASIRKLEWVAALLVAALIAALHFVKFDARRRRLAR